MSKTKLKKNIIAGLDIGATKVALAVAEVSSEGISIIGVGRAPNPGVRHGLVVNIEATATAIRRAVDEAELMSGVSVHEVWINVAGQHVESFESQGMIAIGRKEVQKEDIARVIEAAKAISIPKDREVLHVLPNQYRVDDQEGIHDPIGMSGVRLEASVHIITGASGIIQNILSAVTKARLQIVGLALQQLASAVAVLADDERQLGVCVADVGGGTTDLISYVHGSVVHTATIPVGGNNFTHDVAMGLRTTQADAENIKKKFGCALPDMVSEDEFIEVEGVGGRPSRTISRRELCQVLEARGEETLQLIRNELVRAGLMGKLGSGIVLTGGASHLMGFVEMADFVIDVPVRKGVPGKVGGLSDVVKNADFATVVGLVKMAFDESKFKSRPQEPTLWDRWSKRAKDYLGNI